VNNNCCAKSIIISTYVDQSTKRTLLPHFKHISLRNPSSDIHIVVGKDAPQGKKYNWRNGDKPLFYWWQKNKQKVKGDVIALIEWDTFMSCPIPELPNDLDLAGRTMFLENPNIRNKWKPKGMKAPNWSVDNWAWWNEVEHFNLKNNQTAVGLISFGFFLIRKSLLDCVFSSKWLHLYEKDIISELRLPTIANLEGARIGEIDLPYVDHLEMEIGDSPGIYHPIKHRVDS
jgi:hypothetical protein